MLAAHKQLARKLAELERKLGTHDQQILALVEAIRELMAPPLEPERKRIGFGQPAAENTVAFGLAAAYSMDLTRCRWARKGGPDLSAGRQATIGARTRERA
jgi:hypothetical protein